jgi:hypothetical protein
VNKGDGAKLQWVYWEKLVPFETINGAVSTGNGGLRVIKKIIAILMAN